MSGDFDEEMARLQVSAEFGAQARAQAAPRNILRRVSNEAQGAEVRAPGTDAVGILAITHSVASKLASEVIALSELLCGPTPPGGIEAAPTKDPRDGLLPIIESDARNLRRQLDAAHDAITRIRNHLPSS